MSSRVSTREIPPIFFTTGKSLSAAFGANTRIAPPISIGNSTMMSSGFASDHASTVRPLINSGASNGSNSTVASVVSSMNAPAKGMSPRASRTIRGKNGAVGARLTRSNPAA